MQAIVNLRSRLRSFVRRHWVLVACLALLLALRVALPFVLRPVLVDQVSNAINGRVEIGDLDLWLLRGGVALQDVAVFADRPESSPVIAWNDLYARIRWTGLLNKLVRFAEIRLDVPRVDVDRLKDGQLNLLRLLPRPAAGAPAAEDTVEDAATGAGWAVAADRIVLSRGRLSFRDLQVASPDEVGIEIKRFEVSKAAMTPETYEDAGRVELDAEVAGAPVHLTASFRNLGEDFSVQAAVEVESLPVDRARFYLPGNAWSAVHGRADASVQYEREPGLKDQVRGRVALRDLAVDVADMDRPALRWGSLVVQLDSIDLLRRRANVEAVELDGAAVVVRPAATPILPLLPTQGSGSPTDAIPEPAPAQDTSAADSAAADDSAVAPDSDQPADRPWSWSISRLNVRDTHLAVVGQAGALDVGVRAEARNLTSAGGDQSPVDIELREGDSSVAVKGSARIQPVGFNGSVNWTDLSLPRLLPAAVPGLGRLARSGRTTGQLEVRAAADPAGESDAAGSVHAKGRVEVAELSFSEPESEEFSVQWQALGIDLEEMHVPGVLSAGGDGSPRAPIVVRLERIQLTQPAFHLTRTPEGLVMPAFGRPQGTASTGAAGAVEHAADSAAAAAAQAPRATAAETAVQVEVGKIDVEDGQVKFVDRSVKPFVRSELTAINATVRALAWPELRVAELSLDAAGHGGARLLVSGNIAPGDSRVKVELERLTLPRFNPYASTYSAYSIERGEASVRSKIRLGAAGYDTENHVVLHDLGIQQKTGKSVFRDQFGVPLSLALAIMRDASGDITLDVPVSGSGAGTRVGLLSTVRGALQRAILNAVTSPLKLIGMVQLGNGKVKGFGIEPIRFLPGRPLPVAEGREQAEQVATLLSERPGLMARLQATTANADIRWLQEQDLIAELQQGKNLFKAHEVSASGDVQTAIRGYLEARAAGGSVVLGPVAQPVLDQLLNAVKVSDERVQQLADERAAHIRNLLVQESGLDAERVQVSAPAAPATDGDPAVIVDLAAAS